MPVAFLQLVPRFLLCGADDRCVELDRVVTVGKELSLQLIQALCDPVRRRFVDRKASEDEVGTTMLARFIEIQKIHTENLSDERARKKTRPGL